MLTLKDLRTSPQRSVGRGFFAKAEEPFYRGQYCPSTLAATFPEWEHGAGWELRLRKLYFVNFHPYLPFLAEQGTIRHSSSKHMLRSKAHDLAITFIAFGVGDSLSFLIRVAQLYHSISAETRCSALHFHLSMKVRRNFLIVHE